MNRPLPLSALLGWMLLLLAGCASTSEPAGTSYNSLTDRTTFRTKPMETGMRLQGSGFSNGPRIQYQVSASCKGRACTPEKAALTFLLANNSSPVYFYGRTIVIDAGLERFMWKPLHERKTDESASVVSVIVRVDMTLEQLEALAHRRRVRGRLGHRPFNLSYEAREPLRVLYEQMQAGREARPSEARPS